MNGFLSKIQFWRHIGVPKKYEQDALANICNMSGTQRAYLLYNEWLSDNHTPLRGVPPNTKIPKERKMPSRCWIDDWRGVDYRGNGAMFLQYSRGMHALNFLEPTFIQKSCERC